MARRNYGINTPSTAEKKRLDKEKRRYPGGTSIPANLPVNYKRSQTEDKKCAGCKFFRNGFCNNWKAEVKSEYVCNSWKNPLEGINTFSLEKEVYVQRSLEENIDMNFSEFGKPPIDEDVEQFFQIYRELFYNIPKRGEQSHTTLLQDSKDYIEDYVDPKDTTIRILNNKVESLQEQIEDEFRTQQHPVYPDGSILHVPYEIIGIMQDGHFREISWHTWEDWSSAKPEFKNPLTGEQKSIDEIAYVFPDQGFLSTMKKNPRRINRLEDFNDYSIPTPTGTLNFNKLRNDLEGIRLDEAEIVQLRLIIENKEASSPLERDDRQQQRQNGYS